MLRNPDNSYQAIYGFSKPGFRVGDLSPSYTEMQDLLSNKSTEFTTDAITTFGARSLELRAVFSTAATKCDITVYRVDDGGDTEVVFFAGVSQANADGLFVGPFDQQVDLEGKSFKVKVSNFSGGGAVTVSGRRTS